MESPAAPVTPAPPRLPPPLKEIDLSSAAVDICRALPERGARTEGVAVGSSSTADAAAGHAIARCTAQMHAQTMIRAAARFGSMAQQQQQQPVRIATRSLAKKAKKGDEAAKPARRAADAPTSSTVAGLNMAMSRS